MPSPRWHIIASRYLQCVQPHPCRATMQHATMQRATNAAQTMRRSAGAARKDAAWHTAADEAYCASVDPDAAAILNLSKQTNTPTLTGGSALHVASLHRCIVALLHCCMSLGGWRMQRGVRRMLSTSSPDNTFHAAWSCRRLHRDTLHAARQCGVPACGLVQILLAARPAVEQQRKLVLHRRPPLNKPKAVLPDGGRGPTER
jgi:hypothetical protein